MKQIYLEDEPFDKKLETSLFVNFSESELSNLVPDPVFLEYLQFEFFTSHLDKNLRNSIQSQFTSEGTSNISVITSASPSSSTFHQTSQPQTTPSTPPPITHRPTSPVIPLPLPMANRYAPLRLPANLGAMPQDYQSKIIPFDGSDTYTAQQHTKRMTDYFEFYEIDADDVRMRIFVQSLTGEVRTYFRALPLNNVADLPSLYRTFLNRWENNKDPLQILSDFGKLRRGPKETVQDYVTRFNEAYNVVPKNIRPPPDSILIKFPDGFDSDMAYQLMERAPKTLEYMQSIAISVEANLIEK